MGGALLEAELRRLVAAAGLIDGRATEHFDCFRGTTAAERVGGTRIPIAANFFARKAR